MADDGTTEAESEAGAGGTAQSGAADSPDTADEAAEEPEPTPQAEALRRQQLFVGSGVAALAGIAIVIAGAQRYPSIPVYVFLLVGMATTALLFMFLYTSIFPGSED